MKFLIQELSLAEIQSDDLQKLEAIVTQFDENAAKEVKAIEKTTNHDVKAVEYFLQEKISGRSSLSGINEFIHFACTSEDINNLSHAIMLNNGISNAAVKRRCARSLDINSDHDDGEYFAEHYQARCASST